MIPMFLNILRRFAEGAPADFVLIAVITKDVAEISSAIRSRCVEVF